MAGDWTSELDKAGLDRLENETDTRNPNLCKTGLPTEGDWKSELDKSELDRLENETDTRNPNRVQN